MPMNDQTAADPAPWNALRELAQAAGFESGRNLPGPTSFPEKGDIPLSQTDRLLRVAADHGLSLESFELAEGELVELLGRDVPLLTVKAEQDGGPERWILLRRASEGDALVTSYHGDEREQRLVPLSRLEAELGLEPERRLRWISTELSASAASDAGASSPGEPMHPLRRVIRLVRPDRRDLLAVAVFAIAIGVLLLATPIAVQALVNFVALGGALPPLIVVVLLLFLGLCSAAVLVALQTWVVEILQRRVFVRSVADFGARLPRMALENGSGRYGPELVNRFFDLETIQKRGSFLLLDGLSVLLSVLVGLIVLAFYHPLLLAFDILLLAVIALIILGPIRKGIRTAKAESSAKYEVAAWLEEIARNPTLFKTAGVMKTVFERSDELAREYIDKRSKHFRVAFGQGVAALALQVVASTALLGIGGLLVMQGSLTLGQLVAAELILTLVVSSVAKVGKHLEAFYDLMAAAHKVGMVFDVQTERPTGKHHLPGADPHGAELRLALSAWEPSGAGAPLKDVSLRLAPGDRVGISGSSGSGKSTLLQLIWGLHDVPRGAVRIDGRDLRELPLETLRRAVALVDRIEVVGGTVRENVHLGRSFVSDDDVRDALEKVGLMEELASLPEGIDTPLTVDGAPLSFGQLARLLLARAIAGRPRLLLASDYFGVLDEEEREQVFDVLFDPAAPWTLLFVTNSRRALERCASSFVLRDGALHARPDSARTPA